MATISFKSVGTKVSENRAPTAPVPLPIGITTPMQLGEGSDGVFRMHRDLGDQIADNLRNLILTNNGERLGQYDFGADLKSLVFDYSSNPEWESDAMSNIKTAVAKFMPFVELESFETSIDTNNDPQIATVAITVTFNVPTANISNKAIRVFFEAGG
jgi:phage baseplate assembly protein W